jgi:hypothetical protein
MKFGFCTASLWGLIIFLSVPAVSQDYYPLKVGNSWFYRSVNLPSNDSTVSTTVCVVADSVFSNGQRYYVLDTEDIMGSRYLRSDSASVFYMSPYGSGEQKVFNLDAEVGDTNHILWPPFWVVELVAIDTLDVLGFRDRVNTYTLEGTLYAVLKFSEKFGPLVEWRYGDPPPPWPDYGRELVGCTIDGVDYGKTVDVPPESGRLVGFDLNQNFPNPFNPSTQIQFSLSSSSNVLLTVFDITGRYVRKLVDGTEPAGRHSVSWDGRNDRGRQMSSGVYFYVLAIGEGRQIRRMLLLR